jgi:hypothetical protein
LRIAADFIRPMTELAAAWRREILVKARCAGHRPSTQRQQRGASRFPGMNSGARYAKLNHARTHSQGCLSSLLGAYGLPTWTTTATASCSWVQRCHAVPVTEWNLPQGFHKTTSTTLLEDPMRLMSRTTLAAKMGQVATQPTTSRTWSGKSRRQAHPRHPRLQSP